MKVEQGFWEALGGLYDSTQNLVIATEKLREIAESHKKRFDKLEVIVEWLVQEQRKLDRNEGTGLSYNQKRAQSAIHFIFQLYQLSTSFR